MECQEVASLLVFATFQIQLHKDSLCSLGHGLSGRWPHVGPHQCGHILGWMALFIQHSFLPLPLLWRLESSQNIFLDSFAARILNVNYISPLRISYQGKISRWKRMPSSCCVWPFPASGKVVPGRLSRAVLLCPQLCGAAFVMEATGGTFNFMLSRQLCRAERHS